MKSEILRPLEAELGRLRSEDKYADRTIDLDIVVFDGHPLDRGLWMYAHLAVPMAELLPEIVEPSTGLWRAVYASWPRRVYSCAGRTCVFQR